MANTSNSAKNVKWVEGLRGLASIAVVTTHIARAFDYELFFPRDNPNAQPHLFQLPILRVVAQGRIGVPIFAFLTGFVCALKPMKQAYVQNNQPAALVSIARSAFRRPPRLMLPASIATFLAFCYSVLGFFKTSNRCDNWFVRFDSPDNVGFHTNVVRFFRTLLSTWTHAENPYDRHQWAMRPLLIGAFQVYIVLAATMGMRFRYRMLVHVLLLTFWWCNTRAQTETFGAPITFGTMLCDLSLHRPTQNFITSHQRVLTLVVAPFLLITGLYLGSWPGEHWEWASWSRNMHNAFIPRSIIMPGDVDHGRRFSAVNVMMCAAAIFVSPTLREALSNRWLLWLGHHSFAVYLVHGSILRTVGVWIAYGFTGEPWHPAGKRPDGSDEEQQWLHKISHTRVILSIPFFVVLTYTAAWAWMKYVDTACAKVTQWLEKKVFEEEPKDSSAEKGQNGHVLPAVVAKEEERARLMNGGGNPP